MAVNNGYYMENYEILVPKEDAAYRAALRINSRYCTVNTNVTTTEVADIIREEMANG